MTDKLKNHPIFNVIWVSVKALKPNAYNPNSIPVKELRLLKTSILKDGFTQPIVCFKVKNEYEIVDGYHRYMLIRDDSEINKLTDGHAPIVIIDKAISHRIGSTVRHNRARGSNSIEKMSGLVSELLKSGVSEFDACNELGLSKDEILRYKHITGYSKLYENSEFSEAWIKGNAKK